MNACIELSRGNVAGSDISEKPAIAYWRNLHTRCGEERRVPFAAFMIDRWEWLRAYGCGELGWEPLPLLPRQEEVAAKLQKGLEPREQRKRMPHRHRQRA